MICTAKMIFVQLHAKYTNWANFLKVSLGTHDRDFICMHQASL